jgi:hypothetical protein
MDITSYITTNVLNARMDELSMLMRPFLAAKPLLPGKQPYVDGLSRTSLSFKFLVFKL